LDHLEQENPEDDLLAEKTVQHEDSSNVNYETLFGLEAPVAQSLKEAHGEEIPPMPENDIFEEDREVWEQQALGEEPAIVEEGWDLAEIKEKATHLLQNYWGHSSFRGKNRKSTPPLLSFPLLPYSSLCHPPTSIPLGPRPARPSVAPIPSSKCT
jgi:hypothetical protein